MSNITREDKMDALIRVYEDKAGHAATRAETAALAHALDDAEDGKMTAKLALGWLFGTNEDWPYMTIKIALDTYDLEGAMR